MSENAVNAVGDCDAPEAKFVDLRQQYLLLWLLLNMSLERGVRSVGCSFDRVARRFTLRFGGEMGSVTIEGVNAERYLRCVHRLARVAAERNLAARLLTEETESEVLWTVDYKDLPRRELQQELEILIAFAFSAEA